MSAKNTQYIVSRSKKWRNNVKPFEAILYGVGAFLFGLLVVFCLMLMFADLFEFDKQLDNLWERVKRWFKRD